MKELSYVLLALFFVGAGCTQSPGMQQNPAKQTSTVDSTQTYALCASQDVTSTSHLEGITGGQMYGRIAYSNASGRPCYLPPTIQLSLVSDGKPLPIDYSFEGEPEVQRLPLDTKKENLPIRFTWMNWCSKIPTSSPEIAVTFSGEGQSVRIATPINQPAKEIFPPCKSDEIGNRTSTLGYTWVANDY